MKTLFLLPLTFLFITKQTEKCECLIVPSQGVGNIKIGKSTIEDVRKEFGEKKIEKKWHKAIEVEFFGRYEYFLKYDSVGAFSTFTKHRNKTIIHKLVLNSDSKCKTVLGNGIGSSYKDVVKELGKPKQDYILSNNDGSKNMVLIYENMTIYMNKQDTASNTVSYIKIW